MKTPPRFRASGAPGLFVLALFSAAAAGCSSSSDGPAPDSGPQFAGMSGFNGAVDQIIDAGDGTGDLFFTGSFSHFGASQTNGLVRLNSDFTVDPAFQSPGDPVGGDVDVLAASGDGSVYLAGSFSSIGMDALPGFGRLLPDGSVDTGFAAPSFGGAIEVLEPAPDGTNDIFVGGSFTTMTAAIRGGGTASNRLERLTSTGVVAASFDIGTGFDGTVNVVVPVPDGSGDVLVGGSFTMLDGAAHNGLVRLNADGSVDASLTIGTGFSSPSSGNVLAIEPLQDGSGDFWVGGNFTSYDGTDFPRLVLLNGDGTVDAGYMPAVSSLNGIVESIDLIDPAAGDVLVSGEFTGFGVIERNGLAVVLADGSVGDAFATGPQGSTGAIETIVVRETAQPRVLVGGSFSAFGGSASLGFVGLSDSGAVMTSFGAGTDGDVYQITTLASGVAYVLGDFSTFDGSPAQSLFRLRANGSLDTGFDLTDSKGSYIEVYDVAVTNGPNAALYGLGYFGYSYGDEGKGSEDRGFSGTVARINSDGSVNEGFSVSVEAGIYPFDIAAAKDGSGDLYVAGYDAGLGDATEGFDDDKLVRINSDGSLDEAFQADTSDVNGIYHFVPFTDGSGDLLLSGNQVFNPAKEGASIALVRLNADGSVDESFDSGSGLDGSLRDIVMTNDGTGDIYLVGNFGSYNGTSANRVVRINQDGSVDQTFVPPTYVDGNLQSISLTVDGTGDVVVTGDVDQWDSTEVPRGFVRLSASGDLVLDKMPMVGSDSNGYIEDISPRRDGSGGFYVGGYFSSFAGQAAQNLVRVNANLSVQ